MNVENGVLLAVSRLRRDHRWMVSTTGFRHSSAAFARLSRATHGVGITDQLVTRGSCYKRLSAFG